MVQFVPFQASTNVKTMPVVSSAPPTAMQDVELLHETPLRKSPEPLFGLGTIDQVEPLDVSINVAIPFVPKL